jgi:restriction endonuclease S subunit
MNQNKYRSTSVCLTDIADVDRAQKGKIYPAGTIYVQVSATPKYTDEIWNILKQSGELPGKFAVIFPKIEIIPAYLVLALTRNTAEWQARYIGDAINISMDLFKDLTVIYHPDIQAQAEILRKISVVDKTIEFESQQVELNKEAKSFFLLKMFPGGET